MGSRLLPWSDESDAELRRLAERGYTILRLCIAMKRPVNFLKKRATELGVTVRKPQRLPANERSFGSGGQHDPRVRNSSQ
jgi:hypothetical protein